MNQIAETDHSKQHQTQSQQQDGLAQFEKFTLGYAPAVGKQQRRNEQQQEQFGVKGDVQAALRPGNQRAQGNLYQWQGDGAYIARHNASQCAQQKNKQYGFNGVHQAFCSCATGSTCRTMTKTKRPVRAKSRRQSQ